MPSGKRRDERFFDDALRRMDVPGLILVRHSTLIDNLQIRKETNIVAEMMEKN